MFRVDLLGLDELGADVFIAAAEADRDLDAAAAKAAEYGVQTMQASHPYQDQTYNLSGSMVVEPVEGARGRLEADMVIPAPYAKYVDEGTSRNRAYPFTPLGRHVAEEALEQEAESALARYAGKVSR